MSYKIKFIDSAKFTATSLPNLVDNLTEGIHKIKSKDCDCFLEYESVKDNLAKCKCLPGNNDNSNKINVELKKRLKNTFKFFDNDISKLIFLLKKVCIIRSTWMNGKSFMEQHYLKKKKKIKST